MVSVVIPNYNGEKIIRACLDSLMTQTLKDLEIIIVDNASVDDSPNLIKEYPVVYIQNAENVGFAKAVNQGIKAAKYDYVFLLNSDVVLKDESVSVLYNEILSDTNIFSVQPKMMQFYNQNLIDDAGDIYTPFGWAFQLGHGLPDQYYNKKREIFSCCAGAAIYRKIIFQEIGYFDETFFAYMEDVDIGYRARLHGFRNVYTPETKVYHIGSASFGKSMTDMRSKLSGQNNIKVVLNNMPPMMMILNSIFLIFGFLIKWIRFMFLNKGNVFFQGMRSGVKDRKFNKISCGLKNFVSIQMLMYRDLISFVFWKLRIVRQRLMR